MTETLRDALRVGVLACREGRAAEGTLHLQRCLAQHPDDPQLLKIAVSCFALLGQFDDALCLTRHWIEIAPEAAEAHFTLARLHYERLEISQTLTACEHAIQRDPNLAEAHCQRANALLVSGRMREGWESYEWRFKLKNAVGALPTIDQPQWDGRPLAPGKLLLITDQGYGDCLQFMRFLPWAVQRAPEPVVWTSKGLEPLVRQCRGLGRVTSYRADIGGAEVYLPLSGLPRLAAVDVNCIPYASGYLTPLPERFEHWRRKLNRLVPHGRRRIAIAWAGRPTHPNDRHRSIPLSEFVRPLLETDGVLLSVQKGPKSAEIGSYYGRASLINLGPEIVDFADTLAILKNVERLVTVDTSVAHLAGAAGVTTLVALPFAPDWRWLLDRADSPWYQSITLYRQRRYGDWGDVMERIAADLARPHPNLAP